jgi:hypothetical protein
MNGSPREIDTGEARRQLRNAWLATLLGGGGLILFGNVFDWWPWLIAIIASVFMFFFGVSVRDTEVGSDAKGDSIYYLGLLFTFGALVAALVAFDWESGATSTLGVIRNFGIALLTTIVGLAGRVWYAMSGESPGDLEDAVRGDLESAVSGMKGSLDRARDELEAMTIRFEASAERMADGGEQISVMAASAAEELEKTADSTARTRETMDGYAEDVARIARSTTEGMTVFQKAVEAGTQAARGLGRSLERVEADAASLRDRLVSADEGAERLGATLTGARSAMVPIARGIRESADAAAATGSVAATLRTMIGEAGESAVRAKDTLGHVAVLATESGDSMRATLDDAAEHAERGRDLSRQLARRAERADKALADVHEEAEAARQGISAAATSADVLGERIGADGREFSAAVASVGRTARDVNANLSGLDNSSGELSEVLATTRRQAEGLGQAMADAREELAGGRVRRGLFGRLWGFRRRGAGLGKAQ